MKSAKIFVSKHYKPKVRHDIMFWIGLLFPCSILNELDFVVNCIIVLTNSKLYTESVGYHFDQMLQLKTNQGFLSKFKDEICCETLSNDDFQCVNTNVDNKQELNSPFCVRYKNLLENYLKSNKIVNQVNDRPLNPYYNPSFCTKLISSVLSRIPTTSQMLLGDLSRHNNKIEWNNNYLEFSKEYNKLSGQTFKTISYKNLTQGVIENHFYELKHTYLKGNRFVRLDDFVQQYRKEIKITEKLFANYVMHHDCKPDVKVNLKSKPKSDVPQSRFKKRKRRNSGYYFSNAALNKIKSKNILDFDKHINLSNNKVIKEKVNTKHVRDVIRSDFQFSIPTYWNCSFKEKEIARVFAKKVWNAPLNNGNLTESCITISNTTTLTWADVHTVSQTPSEAIQSALNKCFLGPSAAGWLSQNVVDAYVSFVVQRTNQQLQEKKFGWLCCDNTLLLLNEEDITFSENILSCLTIYSKGDRYEKLRENLFFPILHRSHFMLMWYTHEEIILINSLDQDNTWLLERISKKNLNFTQFKLCKINCC